MLPILLILAASVSFSYANGVSRLQRRTGQTSATCTSDFTWMDNSHNNSPCQVAAQLDAICNFGNWVITALNPWITYTNPDPADGTVTPCTCSWASYNLISACTACQDPNFESKIPVWTVYSFKCGGNLSNEYFPSNITVPDNLTIPVWAGQNPTAWTNGRFNVPAAQQIAIQNNADLIPQAPRLPTFQKESSPVGTIVGGVIGGLMVVGTAIAAAFYIMRQRRKPSHPLGTLPPFSMEQMRDAPNVYMTSNSRSNRSYMNFASPSILPHNPSLPKAYPPIHIISQA